MAGAFSGHLIDNFNPNSPMNSSIVSHGAMSFNPYMHGTPLAQQSFSLFGSQSSFANDSISEETAQRIATLQVKLNRKLGPEYISQRPGPGGGPKLTYVEGWKVINLANEVFGFNGWSSSLVNLTTDFVDYNEESRRYCVGVTAVVRVTLRDGVFHEDVGYGMLENAKAKGAALDKCKKEAVTDGLKRALRNFGNVLGNCLYDKSYTAEIVKIKVEPAKLNKEGLHRRPEFEDAKSKISNTSTTASSSTLQMQSKPPNAHNSSNFATPSKPPVHQNTSKPHTSIPSHIRSEVGSNNSMSSTSTSSASRPSINVPQAQPQLPQQADRRVSFSEPQVPPKPATTNAVTPNLPSNTAISSSSAALTAIKAESTQESDDFGFNDDEFLAMAVEADLGQPIGDEDMGRPIDHEEGTLPSPADVEDEEVVVGVHPLAKQRMEQQQQQQLRRDQPTTSSRPGNANGTAKNSGSLSRAEQIRAALLGSGGPSTSNADGASLSSATGTASSSEHSRAMAPPGPAQSGTGLPSLTSASSIGSSSAASTSMRPPPAPMTSGIGQLPHTSSSLSLGQGKGGPFTTRGPSGASSLSSASSSSSASTSLAQQRHQQYSDRRQREQQQQDQNVNPGLNTNSTSMRPTANVMGNNSSSEGGSRRSTMGGGFNFPPGVNLNLLSSSPSTSASVIGVKRPADAISQVNASNFKGGRPGMGLHNQNQQQQQQGSGQHRQVLGSLEVGEGGDVKRVRR